jgi:hypothetical protein
MNTIRQRLLWLQWLEAYKKYLQPLKITNQANSPQEGIKSLPVDFLMQKLKEDKHYEQKRKGKQGTGNSTEKARLCN